MKFSIRKRRTEMNNPVRNTISVLALFFASILINGCSDSNSLVNGNISPESKEAATTLDFKEYTFELGLDILPFGEATISAEELGVVYFTSLDLISASAFETLDASDFCNSVTIESNNPGDTEFKDCTTGEIKASKFKIKNEGKKRLYLIALVKCKSLYGIIENGK